MGVCLSSSTDRGSGSPTERVVASTNDGGGHHSTRSVSPTAPSRAAADVPCPLPAPPPPPPKDPRFKGCGPTTGADGEIKGCFEDGLLFQVTTSNEWYFYNDTQDYEMHITCTFGGTSEITAVPPATLQRSNDGGSIVSVVVYPEETSPFMKGHARGYKTSFSARPLSKEYRSKIAHEAGVKVQRELDAVKKVAGGSKDVRHVLDKCVQHGIPFVDVDFSPQQASLSRPSIDSRTMEETAWKRPTDYLPPDRHGNICLFCKGINPNDIDQGQLGDCWLLCSIAALAEFPARVKKLFPASSPGVTATDAVIAQERRLGAYRVVLNKHGWWNTILVDDYLPVAGKKPCFAKCVEDPAEMWVSLIEKAYAKVHGSYAAITGGDALHALQDLTGYPANAFDEAQWAKCAPVDGPQSAAMFTKLLAYDQRRFLVNLNTPGRDVKSYMGAGAASNSSVVADRYKKAGLALGHAYTVLQVRHFPEHNARLLQIRNPWGDGVEWTGRWGEGDASWQQFPDIAAAVKYEVAADGTFWMCWEDVQTYFDGGGVCFTQSGWHDYRARGTFAGGVPSVVLEVHVGRPVEAYVTLSQRDKRCSIHAESNQEYSGLMISISKTDDGNVRQQKVHLNSSSKTEEPSDEFTFNCSRDLGMKYSFLPESSPYYVIPRIYDAGDAREYVLGLLTDQPAGAKADGLRVNCVRLPEQSKVFHNFPRFEVEQAVPATTDVQSFSDAEGLMCSKASSFA